MKENHTRLIDAVQKEWDDYPNINEIGNNRVDKIRQETERSVKNGDFADSGNVLVEGISEITVRAIVSLVAERERLKKDRDDWERAKYDVEEIKDQNVLYTECLEKEIAELKKDVSIVNDMLDCVNADVGPDKVILISEVMFAFIKTEGNVVGTQKIDDIYLWSKSEDNDWCEVSDLTELKVWEYQEIKSYAVAVGMITEDEDLFI